MLVFLTPQYYLGGKYAAESRVCSSDRKIRQDQVVLCSQELDNMYELSACLRTHTTEGQWFSSETADHQQSISQYV